MVKLVNISFFIFIGIIYSQNITVDVDRYEVFEGESINYTITVKNGDDPTVNLKNLKDFKVLSGPNSSSQMQWINGKMSSSFSLSWQLLPKKSGKLEIPSFKVQFEKYNSKNTEPITISVLKRTQLKSNKKINQQYFIEASVNQKSPYRGEQIVITYSLYTKINLSSFDFSKIPSYKGFWSKELYSPRNLQFREKRIGNDLWYVSIVKQVALFPTKSGKIIIDPATIMIGVKSKSNRRSFDFFGDDFFNRGKQVALGTNELELNVKKLPKNNGAPSAAVGDWKISSKIDSKKIKQDEAFTFIISIEGKGNIKSIQPSKINFSNSLEIFDPEIKINDEIIQNKLGGKKNIEYVIIPRDYGDMVLPSIDLVYFNVKEKRWKNIRTKEIRISVEKNKKSLRTSIGLSKEEILLVGQDIRYLDLDSPNWLVFNRSFLNYQFYSLLFFIILLYFLPYIITKKSKYFESTKSIRQSKGALKNSIKSIKQIKQDDVQLFYKKIQVIVNNYFSNKTNIFIERSSNEIIDLCKKNNIDKNLINKLSLILERVDAIRYSSISNVENEADINLIQEILIKIDDVWA